MKKNVFLLMLIMAIFAVSCNNQSSSNSGKDYKNPEWSKHSNIYEVNVRQFTEQGTFVAFEDHLDRLSGMGVDILWFMPITPIGEVNRKGELGSYYSVKSYTEINPEFGTIDDFNKIVDHAHELGMHVIIDWVANHTAWDHDWVNSNPEFYKKDSVGNLVSPFDWTDVLALDYDNKVLWNAMCDEMKWWLENTDIDGFRCDVASHVPTEFWDSVRIVFEEIKPEIFMLAEADKPELNKNAFEMSYAWAMHHLMGQVAQGKEAPKALHEQIMKDKNNFAEGTIHMQFTTNHDENSWNGTEYEKMEEAAEIMAAMSFVVPGMPLIYNGQEAANTKRLAFFEKDLIDFSDLHLELFYDDLIRLKNNNIALWNGSYGGDYQLLENSNNSKVLSFIRAKDKNQVVFVGNFSNEKAVVEIDFGKYDDEYVIWRTEEEFDADDNNSFTLDPWNYVILIKK